MSENQDNNSKTAGAEDTGKVASVAGLVGPQWEAAAAPQPGGEEGSSGRHGRKTLTSESHLKNS